MFPILKLVGERYLSICAHMGYGKLAKLASSIVRLIWNLALSGPTFIQHVLHSHYRSITDINWHTQDPNIVVSTGIDSWLWAWDLRATQKPVMGQLFGFVRTIF
jgi:hypothetical protein